jgi:hypothetical protein
MAELKGRMESGEPPEGMPASELLVLHDADGQRALAIVLFDNEADYQKGNEILEAMPSPDTPGQRTSVNKYDVAMRMTS